jgi:hypothetical protein
LDNFTDESLTQTGFQTVTSQGRILLVACGALAREIIALKDANGWDHMELTCLPAIYHIQPSKIPDAVRAVVLDNKNKFSEIFVVYADCGTGGLLQKTCSELGVTMLEGPHCYSFYEGNDRFAELAETEFRSFYLTDFLVRQFDAFVWKPMGLDKHPELLEIYFGNYERLIYQSQTLEAGLVEKAKDCADRLGLAFEHRFTGYGDMGTALRDLAKST